MDYYVLYDIIHIFIHDYTCMYCVYIYIHYIYINSTYDICISKGKLW